MQETVSVDAGISAAAETIEDAVPRVRVVRSGDGLEFHAPSGLWVATLRPRDDGAELTYRTGPTTPVLRDAVTLAERVRDALA